MVHSRRPWTATYRLQVNGGFTFDDVASVAPYLADLGVSHVYLSPILQAAPGSTHGYDLCDPARINHEMGGESGYERATRALEGQGIGQLLDIVPNHMATSDANPWWWDVLKNGVASPYARYFDLRWRPAAPDSSGRFSGGRDMEALWRAPSYIRLPVLGDETENAVRNGELRLSAMGATPVLTYYDNYFPLAPETAPPRENIEAINGEAEALMLLIERQHYRPVLWRTASQEIDYRRFFDINGLVGVRVEDEDVFNASHKLLLDFVGKGRVQGLRVDHIDGLRDPQGYLTRLRRSAPDARILVEKILESHEPLSTRWSADGTTGYEFLVRLNGIFVEPEAEDAFTRLYSDLTGVTRTYESLLQDSKRYVLQELFTGDVRHLASLFMLVASRSWERHEVEALLREVIVALPVYRTYLQPERDEGYDIDLNLVEDALRTAASNLAEVDPLLVDTLRSLLLGRRTGEAETNFVLTFQQFTGPAMAKGAEDTAFYVYNRLVSLNEVGGNPGQFGTAPVEFHEAAVLNAEKWPLTMLASATHDTKRGEETRLRIDALTELAPEWEQLVRAWMELHSAYLRGGLPDTNARYLMYQASIGAWPIDADRLNQYMLKASREAKTHTSWLHNDEAYEAAMRAYVDRVLGDADFVNECEAFAERLDRIVRITSLSQTLVKLTAPGVPDIYQGCELWDLSLVDPDNRRPVDYELRRELLAEVRGMSAREVIDHSDAGVPKLWLIWKVLGLRNSRPELFTGGYTALNADGPYRDCMLAYRRDDIIVVVPRLIQRIRGENTQTSLTLPAGRWRNALTDAALASGPIAMEHLLREFPVALLVREGAT